VNVLGYLSVLCGNGAEAAGDEELLYRSREVPREAENPGKRMRNGETPNSQHSYLAIALSTMGRGPPPGNKEVISVLVVESASLADSSALARFWSAMLSIRLCWPGSLHVEGNKKGAYITIKGRASSRIRITDKNGTSLS